jgi:hypothetical protein
MNGSISKQDEARITATADYGSQVGIGKNSICIQISNGSSESCQDVTEKRH